MKMKLWKPIVLTLAVFALPVVGIAVLFALALCKASAKRPEPPKDYPL
jgi:hypothetical protein